MSFSPGIYTIVNNNYGSAAAVSTSKDDNAVIGSIFNPKDTRQQVSRELDVTTVTPLFNLWCMNVFSVS